MTVTYQREKFDDIIAEGMPLLERHREEIAEFPDLMLLDIDCDLYRTLEAKGKLTIISARDDGKLIGYISLIVIPHGHYKSIVAAQEDVHYVVPEHRDDSTGIMLIKHAVKAMRERGCHIMLMRTKVKHNHGRIFERLGFVPMDVVHIKRLDRD